MNFQTEEWSIPKSSSFNQSSIFVSLSNLGNAAFYIKPPYVCSINSVFMKYTDFFCNVLPIFISLTANFHRGEKYCVNLSLRQLVRGQSFSAQWDIRNLLNQRSKYNPLFWRTPFRRQILNVTYYSTLLRNSTHPSLQLCNQPLT